MRTKRKEQINKLTDQEVINFASYFFDGNALDWIDEYLNDHPNMSINELFDQLTIQRGELSRSADAA